MDPRLTTGIAAASPDAGSAATACVLDSNAVLDWLVFADPHGLRLGQAVMQGRLRWLLCPPMHDELMDVLARLDRLPALQRWASQRRHAEQMVATWATPVAAPPALPPALQMRCSDADDQIFLDLALAHRTPWLVSRDRALLRLARRLHPWGVAVVTPQHWAARCANPVPATSIATAGDTP